MLIIVFWNSEHFEITNISIGRIKKKKLYVYTMDYTFIDKSPVSLVNLQIQILD